MASDHQLRPATGALVRILSEFILSDTDYHCVRTLMADIDTCRRIFNLYTLKSVIFNLCVDLIGTYNRCDSGLLFKSLFGEHELYRRDLPAVNSRDCK